MWIALGLIVALVVAFFVVRNFVRDKDEADYEKNEFVPVRRWGWEMQLTDAEEAALMQGLEAFKKSGGSLYIGHDDGLLKLYDPPVVVSLYLFGARFRGLGPNAMANPAGAVKHLIDGFVSREEPGVVHLQPNWFPDEVDGMNNDQFTEQARTVIDSGSSAGLSGINGWYSDENYGEFHLRVLDQTPHGTSALEAANKYDEAQHLRSAAVNTLVIDLGRVLRNYQALRSSRQELAPAAALRMVLVDMLSRSAPGIGWSKVTANPVQQAIALASVEGETAPRLG